MRGLNTHLEQERGIHLAVRLGASHTGLVVVGEIGWRASARNSWRWARLLISLLAQGIAASRYHGDQFAATLQLLGGFFACQSIRHSAPEGLRAAAGDLSVLYESTAAVAWTQSAAPA